MLCYPIPVRVYTGISPADVTASPIYHGSTTKLELCKAPFANFLLATRHLLIRKDVENRKRATPGRNGTGGCATHGQNS